MRSRRRGIWLSVALGAACLLGVLIWLVDPFKTEAQDYASQVSVRGYQRVGDYLDAGTAPDEDRPAVVLFVGAPDSNVLARLSGPGLVVDAPTNDLDWPDFDLIGEGEWHGCYVLVKRLKPNAWLPQYPKLLGHPTE